MSWQHNGPDLARPKAGDTVTLASDDDRDAAVRVLSEAFAEGRLSTASGRVPRTPRGPGTSWPS